MSVKSFKDRILCSRTGNSDITTVSVIVILNQFRFRRRSISIVIVKEIKKHENNINSLGKKSI